MALFNPSNDVLRSTDLLSSSAKPARGLLADVLHLPDARTGRRNINPRDAFGAAAGGGGFPERCANHCLPSVLPHPRGRTDQNVGAAKFVICTTDWGYLAAEKLA